MKLTQKQVMQIATEAMADPRTVVKIYEGGKSQRLVRERVAEAAKKLKLPGASGVRPKKLKPAAPAE